MKSFDFKLRQLFESSKTEWQVERIKQIKRAFDPNMLVKASTDDPAIIKRIYSGRPGAFIPGSALRMKDYVFWQLDNNPDLPNKDYDIMSNYGPVLYQIDLGTYSIDDFVDLNEMDDVPANAIPTHVVDFNKVIPGEINPRSLARSYRPDEDDIQLFKDGGMQAIKIKYQGLDNAPSCGDIVHSLKPGFIYDNMCDNEYFVTIPCKMIPLARAIDPNFKIGDEGCYKLI